MIDKINLLKQDRFQVSSLQKSGMQEPSFKNNTEITSETSSALHAYGTALLNKPAEQLSLAENIKILKAQGKIESKDYIIDRSEMGNIILQLNNKSRQPIKILHFDNGNLKKCNGWEDYKYTNDKLVKLYTHDENGRIPSYSDYFYNNEIPQENFTKEQITYKTKPQDYIEYLEENNINFKINDDNSISEYDKNNNLIQKTEFYQDSLVRSIYDNNQETHRIRLDKDSTEICTYLEKWKSSVISRDELQQESFTKEHITAETTPEEYISYLQRNNIKFEIKEYKYGERNILEIIEENKNGEKYTSFELNQEKFAPTETIVTREECKPDGTRTRIQFSKIDTCIDESTYD